jgi:hypothetical protein
MEVLEKPKRRHRATRTSTGKHIRVQSRDIAVFRALYDHGPLPTHYLHEFVKTLSPSLDGLKMRLTDLFHEEETEHGGAYLDRPGEDYNAVTKFENEIHDVTAYAEHALEEHEGPQFPRTFESGLNPHRFMVSCTTASLQVAVNDNSMLKWEPRGLILSEAPTKSLRFPCAIARNGYSSNRHLIPDDLFGIEYIGERPYFRLFAVECDRGNEPYERANLDETSLHAKFLRYQKVIGGREYQAHLGRKCGMLVLFVFTTTSKMQGFLERVTEWNGAPCPWILAKTVPCFGKRLSVPPVMRELLTTPWLRAGYAPIDISKPN